MIGLTSARTRLTQRLVARATGGAPVDLTSLEAVPRRLLRPLRRSGLDPVHRIGASAPDPVHRLAHMFGMNIWLVSGQEEAKAVLADQRRFSNDIRPYVGAAGASVGGLGFTDPPEHTRLRTLLTPEFTMRRINRLTPGIEAIVDAQLDRMEASGPVVDLVEEFAFPIPFLVICELLGLPAEDRSPVHDAEPRPVRRDGGWCRGIRRHLARASCSCSRRPASSGSNPGDGLLGRILAAVGDDVSDEEVAGLADGVFTGGYETTASMLALGSLVLLRDRKHFELVRDDDTAIDRVVEEMLRYLSVVQIAFPRFAKEDLDLFGKRIHKGDVVIAALSRADRDHRVGPDLGTFDPNRPPSSHVAFGYGFHRCVGAELARLELRIAFPRLVRRFPELALAVEPETLAFRDKSIVYAVDSLPSTSPGPRGRRKPAEAVRRQPWPPR